MPQIIADPRHVTRINRIKVAPEHRAALLEAAPLRSDIAELREA